MTARDTFELTVNRKIRAPRQKVFDAFVKPDLFRQWMGPRGFKVTALEMDARAAGRYRITVRHRLGDVSIVNGTYREVTPPERIVFTWKWEGGQMDALPETLVTVTFEEHEGEHGLETDVRLLHSGFPAPETRDGHEAGWQGCLNNLIDFVDARGTAATLAVIGDSRSSYVRTVRMALAEKGLAYAYDPAPPHSEQVKAINPFGRVPVFRDGPTAFYETSAIVRYLDETFEGTRLVAENARLRAQMEQWVSLINCHGYDAMIKRYVLQYVFPKGEGGTPDRKTIDGALPEMQLLLTTLDQAYGKRDFLVGTTVTIADLFVTPIIFYLGMFPESKALLEKVPNVRRAHAAFAERESFKATMPKLE